MSNGCRNSSGSVGPVEPAECSVVNSVVESSINLSLLDPGRWGWSAVGGISDLLTPHERAKRKSTKKAIIHTKSGKKRTRNEAFPHASRPDRRNATLTSFDKSGSQNDSLESASRTPLETDSTINTDNDILSLVSLNATKETRSSKENAAVPPQIHDKRSTRGTKGKRKNQSKIRFKALQGDEKHLDIHAYHRGREGYELRDEKTGDLLFQEKAATDTKSSIDTEPRSLQIPVSIRFPIDDDYDNITNDDNESRNAARIDNNTITLRHKRRGKGGAMLPSRYFTETIMWDLSNPQTTTPIEFAAGIAEEFGLTYIQTMDLTDSIQKQIQSFVQENCTHSAPIALRGVLSSSPSQHLLDHRAVQMVPNLYGEVNGYENGGTCQPISQKSKQMKLSRSPSVISNRTTVSKTSEKDYARLKKVNNSTICKGKIPAKRRVSLPIEKPPKLEKPSKGMKGAKFEKSSKAEDIYYWQVRSRILDASKNEIKDKGTNDLTFFENYVCHICRDERHSCAVFACRSPDHAYCEEHLTEKTSLRLKQGQTHLLTLEYCPICSLSCDCAECEARLDSAALEFRKRCLAQKAAPKTTVFSNLFEHCKTLKVNITPKNNLVKADSVGNKDKRRRSDPTLHIPRRVVPKVPLSEFPREVADGVDLDSGYDLDYNTIFTARGSFITTVPQSEPAQKAVVESNNGQRKDGDEDQSPKLIEDGNVDYCNICRAVGNLLCCDFCPRAFHNNCMAVKDRSSTLEDEEKWQCPSCRYEKGVMPEDIMTGEFSVTTMCSAYNDIANEMDNQNLSGFKLLSILLDMLQRLMDYDFGYMFRDPVDTKQIPTYRTVVRKPMDLGTISSNLMKGTYKDRVRSSETALDDIALAVLKDVELVWHNCFIFNFEGSAVYRMAEVQQKRASVIRRASFDHLLSERVKGELSSFIRTCEDERTALRLDRPISLTSLKSHASPRQKAKHKIIGTSPFRSGKGRPVAIFDAETGRIVKIYATIQSASNVVNFFFDMNFDCELVKDQVNSLNKLRNFILQSTADFDNRLFGYRWVLLEDLRGRRVTFPASKATKKPKKVLQETSKSGEDEDVAKLSRLIEMIDGDRIYFFHSIEESLSFPGIDADVALLKEHLVSLSPGFDFTDSSGRKWKRLVPTVMDSIAPQVPDCLVSISKIDMISDVDLMGFGSVEAAYQDWLNTLNAAVEEIEDRSIENFRSEYLEGDRNVDGIAWKAIQGSSTSTEMDETENASNLVFQSVSSLASAPVAGGPDKNNDNMAFLTSLQEIKGEGEIADCELLS